MLFYFLFENGSVALTLVVMLVTNGLETFNIMSFLFDL
ncbi:hypothetical protein BTH41_05231 [Bacillus mycoides]|nr:hypothetical protein BTH41_05231 [Bacillus mycoides]